MMAGFFSKTPKTTNAPPTPMATPAPGPGVARVRPGPAVIEKGTSTTLGASDSHLPPAQVMFPKDGILGLREYFTDRLKRELITPYVDKGAVAVVEFSISAIRDIETFG